MATRFGILAWRIPRAAEPGELLSLGSQGVGHGRATTAHRRTHTGITAGARGFEEATENLRSLERGKNRITVTAVIYGALILRIW